MTPADRGPTRHPRDDLCGVHGSDGKLTGHGCDDLHRFTGPGSTADNQAALRFARPGDPAIPEGVGLGGPAAPDAANLGGPAEPDAADPGDPAIPEGAGRSDLILPGGMDGQPYAAARRSGTGQLGAALRYGTGQLGAVRARRARSVDGIPRPRPGWYGYRVTGPAELPWWAAEVALTIERPADAGVEGLVGAMVLLRASGWASWVAVVAEAAAEIETAAGVRPVTGVDLATGVRTGIGSRLLPGPPLAGLTPVTAAVAQASLGAAGARGLPAPLRRWRPAVGAIAESWWPSAGSVVTCDGPYGVSVQTVVALRGLGTAVAITPPTGGALVLRAWQARRRWGVACGLVVGSKTALGLGREAGRAAARARAEGWDAVVLTGSAALGLARAGRPGQAAPQAAAQTVAATQVTALFETCLAAGGLGGPAAGSPWSLAVTP